MKLQVVFDDVAAVPPALRALVGIDRFGALVFQRRSRLEAMRAAASGAGADLIHLTTEEDRARLAARLREAGDDRLYLHCPSNLVAVDDRDLATFLRQARHAPMGLRMPAENAREHVGWALLDPHRLQRLIAKQREGDLAGFYEEAGDSLADVRDGLRLIDVSQERTLLDFLSGHFDARHFNVIEHDEYVVTKRSKDREKLKREFDFYEMMPPRTRMFLVQPFDFTDDGTTASYKMERLAIPDVALQWVHGAFQKEEFDRFLNHIFHYIAERPTRPTVKAGADASRQALYVDKVSSRLADLRASPLYPKLAPLLDRACGGVDALEARYLAAFDAARRRASTKVLAAGHGDLCFSNILYSKTNQFLKLIDPRGAATADEVYVDPCYDVAKLSHSILGSYDLINHGKFEISVAENLDLRLQLEHSRPEWARPLFAKHLKTAGFDLDLIRLYEASLFISMLPLHIDRPRKVVGFVLTARQILDELAAR